MAYQGLCGEYSDWFCSASPRTDQIIWQSFCKPIEQGRWRPVTPDALAALD